MTSASRATVDFEALARELQQPHVPAAQAAPHGRAPAGGAQKGDPLAELARIIGQDDPFRALLEARDKGRPGGSARIEPSFGEPEPARQEPHQDAHREARQAPAVEHGYGAHAGTAYAPQTAHQVYQEPSHEGRHGTPADAFDQYLASVDHGQYGADAYARQAAAPQPEEEPYQGRALKRVAPRRRLVSVGAGLAVVVLSVTGALTYRGLHRGGSDGGVPIIKADTAPLKIAPKTADGVEIPDQNKQIYEPKAKDGQIRIVNREEQPLDVAQAARSAQGEGASATQGGLGEAFGEPRRVRTVSVKPDTPVPAAQPQQAETQTPVSMIPTMTLPDPTPEPAPAPAPRVRSVRPAASATPPAQPAATIPASAETAPVVPPPAPTRPKAPQRVASVAPEQTAALAAPATIPATTSATEASGGSVGGFSVQLGVRNSQADAQAAFKQMQAKHSELAGQPALIRQAEVNGKTIFRVRVGPLGKSEAASLCSKLQGEGGQCFVAKN